MCPDVAQRALGGTYEIVSTYVDANGQTVPLTPVGRATNFDLDHSHAGPKLNGTISGFNFEFKNQGITGKPAANVSASCGANVFGCVVPASNYSQFMYVYNTPVTNSNGSNGCLLDPYITLATTYGWGNRMFQTNQGPSFPAHQFIFGATSAPTAADDALGIVVAREWRDYLWLWLRELATTDPTERKLEATLWHGNPRRRSGGMLYPQCNGLSV